MAGPGQPGIVGGLTALHMVLEEVLVAQRQSTELQLQIASLLTEMVERDRRRDGPVSNEGFTKDMKARGL